jgi:hypothetical protein
MKKLVVMAIVLVSVFTFTVTASAQWIQFARGLRKLNGVGYTSYYLDSILGRQNDSLAVRLLEVYELPQDGAKAVQFNLLVRCRTDQWAPMGIVYINQMGHAFRILPPLGRFTWYTPGGRYGPESTREFVNVVCKPGFGRKPFNPRANKWPW